jgi:hypothetical protein
MPPPSSYTEAELKTFIVTTLGEVGTILGWTTATTLVTEAVNDTLLALGVSDISSVSGATAIQQLRAMAAVSAWRAALGSLAARYDFADGDQDRKRSQVHKMILESLSLAESNAAAVGVGVAGTIPRQSLVYTEDPYSPLPLDTAVGW